MTAVLWLDSVLQAQDGFAELLQVVLLLSQFALQLLRLQHIARVQRSVNGDERVELVRLSGRYGRVRGCGERGLELCEPLCLLSLSLCTLLTQLLRFGY